MGLWDRLVGGAPIEVSEWVEEPNQDSLVSHQHRVRLKIGGTLIVRSGQVCILASGDATDVFGPGRHVLTGSVLPKLTAAKVVSGDTGGAFKADSTFISVTPHAHVPWATTASLVARDTENGIIRAKASGEFGFVVSDPVKFLRELVLAGDGSTATRSQLAALLTVQFGEIFRTGRLEGADLLGPKGRLGLVAGEQLAELLRPLGITLTRLTVDNLTIPPEVRRRPTSGFAGGGSDGYHAEPPPAMFPEVPPVRQERGLPALPAELADILEPPLPRNNGPKSTRLPLATNAPEGVFEARKSTTGPKSERLFLKDIPTPDAESEPLAPQSADPVPGPQLPAQMPFLPRAQARPATPTATPQALEFHVGMNGAVVGPFDLSTLAAKVREGTVGRKSLVWRPGMDGWLAAEKVGELATLFPAPPPLPND